MITIRYTNTMQILDQTYGSSLEGVVVVSSWVVVEESGMVRHCTPPLH